MLNQKTCNEKSVWSAQLCSNSLKFSSARSLKLMCFSLNGLKSLSNVFRNKLKLGKQPTSSNVHLFREPMLGCPAIMTTNVDSVTAAVFGVYNVYSRCNNMLLYVKWLTCPDVCKAVLQLSQSHSDLPPFRYIMLNFHNPNKNSG